MAGLGTNLFPIAGPGQTVVVPRGSRIVRLFGGDSVGSLFVQTAELSAQSMRNNAGANEVVPRPRARFWSKWLHFDGASWVTTERLNTGAQAAYVWTPLHDHVGVDAPDALDVTAGTGTDLSSSWLFDFWAEKLLGRYVDQDGQRVGVDYVMYHRAGSRAFDTGVAATTWQDTVANGNYEIFADLYVKPALDALLLESRAELAALSPDPAVRVGPAANYPQGLVLVESLFFSLGGADTDTLAHAQVLGESLQKIIYAMEADFGGRVPTVLVRPWDTGSATYTEHAAAQESFDLQFGSFGDPVSDFVHAEGCRMEEQAVAFPGIHPTADGTSLLTRRVCDAVARMAARGATLVPVTAALS